MSRRQTSPTGKTVFIHAGFRKTGTTTVQSLLEDNQRIFSSEIGIITRNTSPNTNALHLAGRDYAKKESAQTSARLRYAARDIDKEIRKMPQSRIIISEENMIGLSIVCPGGDIFDVAARSLSIIKNELSGHKLVFIFSTRHRTSWLRSCYNQDVKVHKFTGEYSEWLSINGICRNWDEGHAAIEATLQQPIIFYPMEEDLSEDRFLGQKLLETVGINSKTMHIVEKPILKNASLNDVELEFMREINKLDLPFSITHKIRKAVQKRPDLFANKKL
nr:hypothetical protein [Paracoccus saliphilus]